MGFEPALYPDVASLWFPDLGQLHNAAAAGTFEWVVAEGGFDALAPLEVLEGLSPSSQLQDQKCWCILAAVYQSRLAKKPHGGILGHRAGDSQVGRTTLSKRRMHE